MPENIERPFFIPRDALDTFNSISWFLADAFWMMELDILAYGFLAPTVLSGLCLLYIEKRIPVFWINMAINSWIVMNGLWMVSDMTGEESLLPYSKIAFVVGVACVGVAAVTSKSLKETFSHFKRFRTVKWAKTERTF